MATKASRLFFLFGLPLFVIGVLILRPVPIVTESECEAVTGVVANVYEGSRFDVCFRLKDSDKLYYINRGLEQGLELDELRRDLVGREITLKYPRYWTPLDPVNATRHISKLEFGERVLFDETKQG